jgi:two-component system phosphate regulon sensor histidine kinase PhoR
MFQRLLLYLLGLEILTSLLVGLATYSLRDAVLSVFIGSALAVVGAYFISRSFTRTLHDLGASAGRVTADDRGVRMAGDDWPESRDLANSLNEMAQRLHAEIDRVRGERSQLRAILASMAEGVVAIGPGQRVLFANEAAGRMLDFDAAAAVDRPLYELTRQPAIQSVIERGLTTREPQRESAEIKKPTPRHVSLFVAPLRDSAGAILVIDDISELRRLERLRQEFVANVSHELKTPLAVMKACVETLQDGAVEDPEARGPFLQQIADGADRLHALILDLLSLARIESGEEMFEFESLPVQEIVELCLDRFRPRAESKRLALEAAPPPQPLSVWADSEALGQILDNLVDNAVKYTPDGGAVRVRWTRSGENVSLSVEDTGPGIPERDLPRIFERFYRVDKARARQLGGTGLGLSIVKHLASAMNGTVKVSSRLEEGSTFTICLRQPES